MGLIKGLFKAIFGIVRAVVDLVVGPVMDLFKPENSFLGRLVAAARIAARFIFIASFFTAVPGVLLYLALVCLLLELIVFVVGLLVIVGVLMFCYAFGKAAADEAEKNAEDQFSADFETGFKEHFSKQGFNNA